MTRGIGASAKANRFRIGDTVERRELTTIRGTPTNLPAKEGLTHLQFRRYAGCPICNLHLRSVSRRIDEIAAAGIHEVVVFHSPREVMLPLQGELPFAVIADPERRLYREFGVERSLWSVLHPRAWTSLFDPRVWFVARQERRAGGSPSPTRGESALGLPADFLIDSSGRVRAASYGRHASDHWSVDELLELGRSVSATPPTSQPTTRRRPLPRPGT
jgi:peroxiredoxin